MPANKVIDTGRPIIVPNFCCCIVTMTLILLCPATLPAQTQRPAPEWGLTSLFTALHQVRASAARFVETKYLHVLNQAQRSSGRLNFVAPAYLMKETTEPVAARLTINGDRLTVERQGEPTKEISLHDHSEIGALVESVRATLAGDLPALNRYFTATLEGQANGWSLTLTPREPKLHELVSSIRIRGQLTAIQQIETMEADGDRTDMAITPEPK
jgi:Outer membrane lipoprotein carrier protein LolA-like